MEVDVTIELIQYIRKPFGAGGIDIMFTQTRIGPFQVSLLIKHQILAVEGFEVNRLVDSI